MEKREIKFRVRKYDSYQSEQKEGVVLDKYLGIKKVKIDMPSGKGGTTSGEVFVNIDFYLIRTKEGGLYHIEGCDIVEILEPNQQPLTNPL